MKPEDLEQAKAVAWLSIFALSMVGSAAAEKVPTICVENAFMIADWTLCDARFLERLERIAVAAAAE